MQLCVETNADSGISKLWFRNQLEDELNNGASVLDSPTCMTMTDAPERRCRAPDEL